MSTKARKIQEDHSSKEEFDMARDAAAEAWEQFKSARAHMQTAALAAGIDLRESANEQFDETLARLKEKQQTLVAEGSEYVRANPVKSAGLAFVTGFVISKLLK